MDEAMKATAKKAAAITAGALAASVLVAIGARYIEKPIPKADRERIKTIMAEINQALNDPNRKIAADEFINVIEAAKPPGVTFANRTGRLKLTYWQYLQSQIKVVLTRRHPEETSLWALENMLREIYNAIRQSGLAGIELPNEPEG